MADSTTLQRFGQLASQSYIPSVGSWVQVVPPITTVLNAFNTLGRQSLEIFLIDHAGNTVGTPMALTMETGQALRLDFQTMVPAANLPFEGCVWIWAKGDTTEGSIGLQAIDLDFIDRDRPTGHVLGTVHIIYDFFNTLGIAPYLDLVSPRVLVEKTPEGADRYANYLGMAHVLVSTDLTAPELEVRISNESGDVLMANQTLPVPLLGSAYIDLRVPFPNLDGFLIPPGAQRGFGTLNVREASGRSLGLTAMLKVVDLTTGELMVDHLNDRSFARPAQKG